MRISTSMIFDLGTQAITRQQAELLDTQQHIASGKRIIDPADDPVGAAQSVHVEQALNVNTQYSANLGQAKAALALTESVAG